MVQWNSRVLITVDGRGLLLVVLVLARHSGGRITTVDRLSGGIMLNRKRRNWWLLGSVCRRDNAGVVRAELDVIDVVALR